ncbi:MAG TPA: citramalate synthase [Candidatus Limnocylindria bacterium]|nr:citramalate synthase [Candidatus Limnocylindria bacterium]
MRTQIEIYDTTLRDGAQAEGINFSLSDKLRIADRLDQFGVHYIEGGWPGSNPKDMEFFQQAARRSWRHAKIASFGFTRKKGVRVEDDPQIRMLLDAQTPVITIVGKTWLLHVKEVLATTAEENLAMISDTIRYLKDQGRIVMYDAEHSFDGYKDEPDFAMATWKAAADAGADCVVLCETNGGALPTEVSRVVQAARAQLTCAIGIHTHNDAGLGVANGIAALEAGARQIQGTINGYGERTGNCNLTSVMPLVQFKLGWRGVPEESLPKLKELSEFVDEIANVRHDPRQPWVGQTAFAHKGGIHVHAIERVARSYEHIQPEAVGNYRRVLVSDMSGRTNILVKAKELGFELAADQPETRQITTGIKDRENRGYEYEAAEASLALLIRNVLEHRPAPPFAVETYHVSMRGDSRNTLCEATVKVRVGETIHHTVAEGDGPVNALDGALRTALARSFPKLQQIRLTDYKVRILDGIAGTAAKTRVLITTSDGHDDWGTVGVSENIITASLEALLDSIEYALLKK